jgi:hypothetical protein
MENKSSKSIQILLGIIAIVLVVIVVLLVRKNSDIYSEKENQKSEVVITNNPEKELKTSEFTKYVNNSVSFSYKNGSKIVDSRNIPNVIKFGISENDPSLETVEIIPDMNGADVTPYLDNAQYKKEVYGENTFEVFESTEGDYYKHFVLVKENVAISIVSKNEKSQYIDLSTVSFNK